MEENLDLLLELTEQKEKEAIKKIKEQEDPTLWWFSINTKDDS